MKINMKMLLLLAMVCMAFSCGDDGDEPTADPTPTVTAPTVVSTTPASNAANVTTGTIDVVITYDKDILMSSDASLQPIVTGATLTGTPTVSGKTLAMKVYCSDYEQLITIALKKGFIGVTGALADAYSFSFTTEKKPEVKPTNITQSLVNGTTDQVIRLYKYFLAQYGSKVLSSVMADVNWNNNCAEKVFELTGKYPAMNCYDFIHILYSGSNSWINYDDITPVKSWADAGGIVQLMWHFNVPKSEGSTDATCTPSETTFRANNIFTDGSWENKWFYEQMDKVVAVLLKLQEAGIAATWRPFHEAAGNAMLKSGASWGKAWFWWGYDGADIYKKLWVTMFDYFKQKGVSNLIWIWTTQNDNGDSSTFAKDTEWYPGDSYVDMVARDLYGCNADKNLQEFTEIQQTYPSKMVVLGECGKGDAGEQGLIADCWSKGALWGHFMVWYQGGQGSTNTMCSDAWWKDAMSSSIVITRDQVAY